MKGLLKSALCAALLAFSLTGCKGNKKSPCSHLEKGKQQITINIKENPGTLDPRKARALSDLNLIRMFMEGLTRVDGEGKSGLAIAKHVDLSPDKRVYTFTLRNCYWSNGEKVTSSDFAYAWKQILSPSFHAPNAYLLYVIKNAKNAKKGEIPLSLVGIETPDEKTLIVTLDYPASYFMELISHPIFFPVNSRIDRLNPQWAQKGSTYVGNGPFSIETWKWNDLLEITQNPHYWDKKLVKLAGAKMVIDAEATDCKKLDAQKLEWTSPLFSLLSTDKTPLPDANEERKLHTTPILATQWVRINNNKPPLGNKNFRKALAYAINRQEIIERATQGSQNPATGIVPPSMNLQESPIFKDGDLVSAQKLFQNSLSELNLSAKKPLKLVLLYPVTDRSHFIAQAIQKQWREGLGIEVHLEAVNSREFFERIAKGDYMLSLGSWFADFNDPINFLEVFKTKNIGTNNTGWENPSYTKLLKASYTCSSPEERKSILSKAEQLLISEMPVIPLFQSTMLYTKQDEIKGVVLSNMGSIDFKWAYVE